MRILLIPTGGTIACKTQNNQMNVTSKTAYDIFNLYRKIYKNVDIEFDTLQPFTILSENYTCETYNKLIDFLYQTNFNNYDGVIMTHGSDTLSYTSALVGMLLRNIDIPFMITASDYPITNKLSNGLSNFSACVEFIKSKISNGIFTVYGKKSNPIVYLSTRICEANPISDNFSPFGNGIVAEFFENEIVTINKELVNNLKLKTEKNRFFTNKPFIKNDILLIKTYPNQNFECYNIENISAVVIYMYHSGTACIVGENTNICNFIKKCNFKNIPVYTASHKNKSDNYITTLEIEKYTSGKLYNISQESAYIKTLLSFNQDKFSYDYVINSNIYFECSE